MNLDAIKAALLASYEIDGGINHLDGNNLPTQDSVNDIARDCMHLLFPGFFEEAGLQKKEVPALIDRLLLGLANRMNTEIEKSLRFGRHADPADRARQLVSITLERLPELRRLIRTDVAAAFAGDPSVVTVEEIILAYPCVLAISLQRFAHVLYELKVPLLPRMITEYGHDRTGIDIHPGARIGSHFFIDHGTGVVIGETATIGDHVKLYQGVTLGAKSFELDIDGNPVKGVKRHPDIGDHVTIYAHATILGGETKIGSHSVVGGNVWLLDSLPAHTIAYFKGDNLVIRPREKIESMIEQASDWMI